MGKEKSPRRKFYEDTVRSARRAGISGEKARKIAKEHNVTVLSLVIEMKNQHVDPQKAEKAAGSKSWKEIRKFIPREVVETRYFDNFIAACESYVEISTKSSIDGFLEDY